MGTKSKGGFQAPHTLLQMGKQSKVQLKTQSDAHASSLLWALPVLMHSTESFGPLMAIWSNSCTEQEQPQLH